MTTMTMREMFNQGTTTITDTHVGNNEKIVSTGATEQICLLCLQSQSSTVHDRCNNNI